ncbi:hypothetical protein [Streptomyces sp. WAC06614]|uniref:hypothetical protein n=1 Tax=Streptomyces sp. WAC06614 TaxID=2487416 RepID=UPI00163C9FE9|nr:hypothetical protein [Streptomyces sp. WAC06614]
MRSTVVKVCAEWAVLVGITLVLITSPGPVEYAVAAVGAAGATAVARRMRRLADVRVRGLDGLLPALARLPLAAVRGAAVLAYATVRPRAVGARTGRIRLREGADPGWAALVLGWSADTCVVEFPRGRPDEVVVHRLGRPAGGPAEVLGRSGGGR